MNLVVLSDFDGTVVDIDTSVFILTKFAQPEWRVFDDQFERGEISLEACMREQFSTVRVSKARILKEIEDVPTVRRNFEKLIEYCQAQRIPLILVTAGVDFVIKHFIKHKGWAGLLEVFAPKARTTSKGIEFTFPKMLDKTSANFKDDLVKHYEKQGKRVAYIGDGTGDYEAAKNASFSFAIKDSKLAELLKKDGIPHKEIDDFQDVVEAIRAEKSL